MVAPPMVGPCQLPGTALQSLLAAIATPVMTDFNDQLLDFLAASPTPFHACAQMAERLEAAGFSCLHEHEDWDVEPGRYYTLRNSSSIIAFVRGTEDPVDGGIRMVGAHTDSPCLRLKPNPDTVVHGYLKLGVEVYGGVLLNPWYDRDLSLAGRVTFRGADGNVASALIDFARPVAIIPSLAIHLDRGVNDKKSINAQRDIPPVVLQDDPNANAKDLITRQLAEEHPEHADAELLAWELSFYDCNPPALTGLNGDFIASARLDNLLSCFIGLKALLNAGDEHSALLVCNDHEEVGSNSASGAAGPFLGSVLTRIVPEAAERDRTIARSLLISADNAHGIHPNFADRHDGNHGPLLNAGPVIKINANQRYASNSETSGYFANLCKDQNVPCQTFVTRSDMACGSTIGPITATEVGVPTLDVGVPQFAMHSIRELAGARDPANLTRVFDAFFADAALLAR